MMAPRPAVSDRRFYEAPADGARRSAPAALRNREPIADVLAGWLPKTGLVLEVASGTGEHVIHFAGRFPNLDWQPSDINPEALTSIAAWRATSGLTNVRASVVLDSTAPEWPVAAADAILSLNMVHISPWQAALGLLDGAARILSRDGVLILYGPWLSDEIETAPSNLAFDADLKRRDAQWGLRPVEAFAEAALERGLELAGTRTMPANNLMLRLHRSGPKL